MRWGIRAQVLVTLSVVVAFGLIASYLVTSRVTRSAALEARVQEARAVVSLAAERFVGVPVEGLALAETLARVRPLVAPDLVYVVGTDMRPIVDGPGSAEVKRFDGLVAAMDLAPLRRHRHVSHSTLNGVDGEPLLVAMAPVQAAPRRLGRSGAPAPAAVCVLAPLGETLSHVERLDTLFLLFTATILVLALVLGYALLGRAVVRPVMRLVRVAERVSTGDLSPSPTGAPRASGELGELQGAFDRMTRQLDDDRRRIQLQISELELANREIAAAQARLVLTEKLASVGELAAGVAHEIGNPIAILQGYLEMLGDEDLELPAERRREYVGIMEDAVDRVADINPGADEVCDGVDNDCDEATDESDASCDARAAVEAAAKLVRPQRRFHGIELTLQLPDEPVGLAIPEGRLEQVALNLLLNAADASAADSTVVIGVEPGDDAGMAQIWIVDEGEGIPAGDISRVFDPFFTTKDPGSGTGLGLAVVHGIIKTWGGRVDVDSTVGRGTRFTVHLPTLARAADAARAQDSP